MTSILVGLTINTRTTKEYKLVPFSVADVDNIVFEAKACQDITVLLADDANNNASSVYEIIIGKPPVIYKSLRKQFFLWDFHQDPNQTCL